MELNHPLRYGIWSVILLLSCPAVFGQVDSVEVTRDQVLVLKDSIFVPDTDTILFLPQDADYRIEDNTYADSEFYTDSINNIGFKNRIKNELLNLIIRHHAPQDALKAEDPVKSVSFFKSYQGKIIRNIDIMKVDMFTGSVSDTTIQNGNGLYQKVNQIHRHTSRKVILNNILFSEGDELDPYQISDSERFLRSLSFIQDARIYVKILSNEMDYVDVIIVTQDRFPWELSPSAKGLERVSVEAANLNIFGTGNLFSGKYLYNAGKGNTHGYDFVFRSRNVSNTFVDVEVFLRDNYIERGEGFTVRRRFLSPEIKYGGEFSFQNQTRWSRKSFADTLFYDRTRVSRTITDVWLGKSFETGTRQNFNIAYRYLKIEHENRPEVEKNINERFHDRSFYLIDLSFNKLTFLKTKNIVLFNITEDIPTGFLLGASFGYDYSEFGQRDYISTEIRFSEYSQWGYFLVSGELGMFFREDVVRDQIIDVRGLYFTPLFELGRYYNRWFLKVNYFNGNNLNIPITFNLAENDRIRGLRGSEIQGDQLLTLSVESVLFMPQKLGGFRFAPYAFSDVGSVRESRFQRDFDDLYYTLGAGLRVRNENLVFDTFDFRIGVFPERPNNSNMVVANFSITVPVLFQNFNVRKPRILGLE